MCTCSPRPDGPARGPAFWPGPSMASPGGHRARAGLARGIRPCLGRPLGPRHGTVTARSKRRPDSGPASQPAKRPSPPHLYPLPNPNTPRPTPPTRPHPPHPPHPDAATARRATQRRRLAAPSPAPPPAAPAAAGRAPPQRQIRPRAPELRLGSELDAPAPAPGTPDLGVSSAGDGPSAPSSTFPRRPQPPGTRRGLRGHLLSLCLSFLRPSPVGFSNLHTPSSSRARQLASSTPAGGTARPNGPRAVPWAGGQARARQRHGTTGTVAR